MGESYGEPSVVIGETLGEVYWNAGGKSIVRGISDWSSSAEAGTLIGCGAYSILWRRWRRVEVVSAGRLARTVDKATTDCELLPLASGGGAKSDNRTLWWGQIINCGPALAGETY